MRGNSYMREWEVNLWTNDIKKKISTFKSSDKEYLEFDYTNEDVCPANINFVLTSLGFKQTDDDFDTGNKTYYEIYESEEEEILISIFYEIPLRKFILTINSMYPTEYETYCFTNLE